MLLYVINCLNDRLAMVGTPALHIDLVEPNIQLTPYVPKAQSVCLALILNIKVVARIILETIQVVTMPYNIFLTKIGT